MTTQQQQPRRATASRRKRFFLSFLGLGIAFLVVFYGLHYALNPWALSLPGKPALTGHWTGTVSFAPGDERRIVLHIVDDRPRGRCRNCPDIDGAGKVCGATQQTRYEIWGDPDNYKGTRFTLHTRSATEGPGTYVTGLNGEWDGNDLLTLTTTLTVRDADGGSRGIASTDRPPDPPLRFSMHRGSEAEFNAAC